MMCQVPTRKEQTLFLQKRRHTDSVVDFLSQSYSDLLKSTTKKNSNLNNLLKQTLEGLKNLCNDLAGYKMSCTEIKELCRKASKMKIKCFFILLMDLKRKTMVRNVFVTKRKTILLNVYQKQLFAKFKAR